MSACAKFATCLALAGCPVLAAGIDGMIVIKRVLTKRKVTAPASAYQRGIAVELDSEQVNDPLGFERSRVAVYVEDPLPSKPLTQTIEQKGRRFYPDLLVVPVGSTVSFPNLDPIFHNVFSLSKPKSFDLGNYPRNETRKVVFPQPGIVFIYCHLHPNMTASIVVTPNEWGTTADASGRFSLPALAPGSYTIVAWHKAAGFFRQRVQVTPDAEAKASVQFIIPLDDEGLVAAHR